MSHTNTRHTSSQLDTELIDTAVATAFDESVCFLLYQSRGGHSALLIATGSDLQVTNEIVVDRFIFYPSKDKAKLKAISSSVTHPSPSSQRRMSLSCSKTYSAAFLPLPCEDIKAYLLESITINRVNHVVVAITEYPQNPKLCTGIRMFGCYDSAASILSGWVLRLLSS